MSAPHTILDNLPLLCQKLSDLVEVRVVITKIILLVFFETRCTDCVDIASRSSARGVKQR